MGTLYVVGTPIGNMEDITLRAIRVLKEVKLIAAEDTRKTRNLLSRYQIDTPLTSYFEHNKLSKLEYILTQTEKYDVALVSNAGMPGLSDPGFELVREAINRRITVVPVPGPSSVVTALVISGLPTDRFLYLGFLPRKAGERKRALSLIADREDTLLILEAPHRLRATLDEILITLGDRQIAVCRELTKIYEEVFRGKISEAARHFSQPKGEFVLVIGGREPSTTIEKISDVTEIIRKMKRSGLGAKETAELLGNQTGISKRTLYEEWLKL